MSWNVSGNAFVTHPAEFRALVKEANADVLLLDEVAPSADEGRLRGALAGPNGEDADAWHIDFGNSGGRQRGVIAGRMPLEKVPELSGVIAYPEPDRRRILGGMSEADDLKPFFTMEDGIPVNGAVAVIGERRLLLVIVDLQCCGDGPGSWHEDRRRAESREIRRRIRLALDRTPVDGLIVAGDFNLVSTPLPLVILSGPYPPPHPGLIAAEVYHLDGSSTWTWDGRGTPYPSSPLDYVLYSPGTLRLRRGLILDSEDLGNADLDRLGLQRETSNRMSEHRPLVTEFEWRQAPVSRRQGRPPRSGP